MSCAAAVGLAWQNGQESVGAGVDIGVACAIVIERKSKRKRGTHRVVTHSEKCACPRDIFEIVGDRVVVAIIDLVEGGPGGSVLRGIVYGHGTITWAASPRCQSIGQVIQNYPQLAVHQVMQVKRDSSGVGSLIAIVHFRPYGHRDGFGCRTYTRTVPTVLDRVIEGGFSGI